MKWWWLLWCAAEEAGDRCYAAGEGRRCGATKYDQCAGCSAEPDAGRVHHQSSGQVGESYRINIRGLGTASSNEPLYVIDGVPGGSINSLNPSDIESIDILKDAASAAIYGARAAKGFYW